jgi:hypothetical protein
MPAVELFCLVLIGLSFISGFFGYTGWVTPQKPAWLAKAWEIATAPWAAGSLFIAAMMLLLLFG